MDLKCVGRLLLDTEEGKEEDKNKTIYNTLALPVLLYGSETWTVKARDARRITAAEMKYMRRTAGYTWDRLQNKFKV